MTTKKKIDRSDVIAYIKECTAVDLGQLLIDSDKPIEKEEKKGFAWEESFNGVGYFIDSDSFIRHNIIGMSCEDANRNVFRTEKQALSALAFSQLSHIVHKYNGELESFESVMDEAEVFSIGLFNGVLAVYGRINSYRNMHLPFLLQRDAEQSLITNKELWEL